MDSLHLRQGLADWLRRRAAVRSAPVEAAFRRVPRHLFLPQVALADAYRDDVVVTRRDATGLPSSSSSQPSIMAIMLEQLAPQRGHRVLEVGTGTGYNAALIRELVGPEGRVVTVEIQADVAQEASLHLAAAGYPDVTVVAADGGVGYSPEAPYDRIIVTASCADIPPAWRQQLVPGGRLVVPLRVRTQCLSVAFSREGDVLRSQSVQSCGFMYLRGAYAGDDPVVDLGEGLFLSGPAARKVPPDLLEALLSAPPRRVGGLIVPVNTFGLGGGLGVYLALQEPGMVDIFTAAPERWGFHSVSGLLDISARSLCLIRPDGVVVYGSDAAAGRLRSRVLEWVARGRPPLDHLHLEVWPADDRPPEAVTEGRTPEGRGPNGRERWVLRYRWSDVVCWFDD
ncbi:MAG: class I SAM-dependent methyltransferase [Armatimonadota bacterium]|nr:class I SAM-dependent methyltransferase [Armatimonadota bacterium]MDR7451687.1 class I SAM-dependent methyltransferase [Armatimonadota bacterium]MDR7465695.1 class I SAM-dependent methyltransferase [Armatimonadota bacterium]MDR7493604.1 class I SAM-dependent methyltransferase [Armatimonadota bacterium]MDR7499492.1 class I SAM-dependent methyltransferase [Armatimonadota bacterium]